MEAAVEFLPHVNASLNGAATVLLVVGYVLIKQRREQAHKWTMLSCFGVSAAFLVCYLVHKTFAGTKGFPEYPPAAVRYTYFAILLSHMVLAAAVPFLALTTIYFGLRDRRQRHVRLARWTFPIWLYVSITGVIVYLMLYQIFPPRTAARIMQPTKPARIATDFLDGTHFVTSLGSLVSV